MIDNKKLFCKLWNKHKQEPMLFISSNSGTGKTTFFKWLFIRRAYEKGEHLDIIFRWLDDLELKFNDKDFLTPPINASKRLLKLVEDLAIIKEAGKYFLIKKQSKEKIGQAFALNIQGKSKSTENYLVTARAFFDEVLADDMHYASEECYKFARLCDTRRRYRPYQAVCLYNNVTPFFPYKDFFGTSGAKFIDFVAGKYTPKGYEKKGAKDFGDILSNSKYGEIYNFNNYKYYEEFYRPFWVKGKATILYLQIYDRLFALKELSEFYALEHKTKIKKNREVYTIDLANNNYVMAPTNILNILQQLIRNRLLFVNNKNDTIYIKQLADYLNLCYNI